MAGHSHWANIKRAKGATDKKRATVWSKISRKIIIAAKNGGDPKENLSLRYVIEEAKASNMPRDTIQNAIKKGTGELGADNYEAKQYEAYGPGGVAIIIDGLTNNPARTAADLRTILERNGGSLGTSGSVAFQFNKRGVITEAEGFAVLTTPTAFHKVREALATASVPIESGDISHVPLSTIAVDGETAGRVLKLVDALEDNDDVQNVYHNAEMPNES
jgi:transcriptional/translational regulatory protein YebC/TACO1